MLIFWCLVYGRLPEVIKWFEGVNSVWMNVRVNE